VEEGATDTVMLFDLGGTTSSSAKPKRSPVERLFPGRFQMPVVDEKRRCVEMEGTQLAMLLDGIDLNAQRLPRWRPSIEMGIDGNHRS
jgi:hypothetical protein